MALELQKKRYGANFLNAVVEPGIEEPISDTEMPDFTEHPEMEEVNVIVEDEFDPPLDGSPCDFYILRSKNLAFTGGQYYNAGEGLIAGTILSGIGNIVGGIGSIVTSVQNKKIAEIEAEAARTGQSYTLLMQEQARRNTTNFIIGGIILIVVGTTAFIVAKKLSKK